MLYISLLFDLLIEGFKTVGEKKKRRQNETSGATRGALAAYKGGAAITCKNELETINEENLHIVSKQLQQVMFPGSASGKVLGMDWSKRPGVLQTPSVDDEYSDQSVLNLEKFIVVHGAGSFRHFQASKSGVHKGGLSRLLVKAGFIATRTYVSTTIFLLIGLLPLQLVSFLSI